MRQAKLRASPESGASSPTIGPAGLASRQSVSVVACRCAPAPAIASHLIVSIPPSVHDGCSAVAVLLPLGVSTRSVGLAGTDWGAGNGAGAGTGVSMAGVTVAGGA